MGWFTKRRSAAPEFESTKPQSASPGPADAAYDLSAPDLSPPNEAELAWMAGHLHYCAERDVDIENAEMIAALYERLRATWASATDLERPDPNPFINALGTALGEHLVRRCGMRWVVAADAYGNELAVVGPVGDLIVYPANAVGQRWATQESGAFVVAISDETAAVAGRLRS